MVVDILWVWRIEEKLWSQPEAANDVRRQSHRKSGAIVSFYRHAMKKGGNSIRTFIEIFLSVD